MIEKLATVVIQPRDRFSLTAKVLATFYDHTPGEVRVIFVDTGSPTPIQEQLRHESQRRGFELIRRDEFLSPNQVRNLVLPDVKTPYVVFLDNDVLVHPGWLERLVFRARDEQAALVGPLYLEDGLQGLRIHMAGGEAQFSDTPQGRHFVERHYLYGVQLDEVRQHLRCVATDMLEFHCICVATDFVTRAGGFDEGYLSCRDTIDLCLQARQQDLPILLEAESRVTFLKPPPIAEIDRDLFRLRWSDAWNRASLDHFQQKWKLASDDPSYADHLNWLTTQRQLLLEPIRDRLRPFGRGVVRFVDRRIMSPLESRWNRRQGRSARAA